MKRILLLAVLVSLMGLTGCTTLHKDRRQLLSWNLELVNRHANKVESPKKVGWDQTADTIMDWVLVEPIAVLMLPITWAGDTLIINPIDGWKKAELSNTEMRFGGDDERGDAEAAVNGYGPIPVATPWWISDLLALPRFLGQWVWNSTYPTDPVDQAAYNEYWNRYKEKISE